MLYENNSYKNELCGNRSLRSLPPSACRYSVLLASLATQKTIYKFAKIVLAKTQYEKRYYNLRRL